MYKSPALSAAPSSSLRCGLRLRLTEARRKSFASAPSAALRCLRTSASDSAQGTSSTSVLNRRRRSQRRSSCWVVGTSFIRRILMAFWRRYGTMGPRRSTTWPTSKSLYSAGIGGPGARTLRGFSCRGSRGRVQSMLNPLLSSMVYTRFSGKSSMATMIPTTRTHRIGRFL